MNNSTLSSQLPFYNSVLNQNVFESEFRSSDSDSPNISPLSSGALSFSWKRKAGRKKFRETRHPIYRGIRQREGGKWVCEVREPKKKTRIWVGTYPNPEQAARAYDVAVLALRGNLASLNFPSSAWLAPRAKSTAAGDIKLAALQATRFALMSSLSPSSSPSSSTCVKIEEHDQGIEASRIGDIGFIERALEDSRELFLDEEAIFNMPRLIDSMAEAMLLTPPALKRSSNSYWDEIDERVDSFIDFECLW